MPVRAITFDFWRTLFSDQRDPAERRRIRINAVCRVTGAAPEAVRDALLTSEREFLEHHIQYQVTLGPMDAVRIVARELDVSIPGHVAHELAGVFGAAILEYPPSPIAGGLDAVRAASARVPIGIISDAGISPGRSLRTILDRNGYTRHFRHMAFSDEVGVAKPQALMFESTAKALGVAVSELLHIGDLEGTDVRGAKAVGASAGLFVGDHDRYRNTTTADHIFENWAHFIELLPSLS
ncbi:MAG: HAD family hydrolase [Candidatus Hydrogenedentes bacterium]|nr:HAD family hydrolase [Candidatus Hydrogenedentota bacterium]